MKVSGGAIFWTVWAVATVAYVFSPTLPIALVGAGLGGLLGACVGLAILAGGACILYSALVGRGRLYRRAYLALAAGGVCVACGYVAASHLN